MSRLKDKSTKTWVGRLWEEFRVRYRFKYVLPKVNEATLDGIRLDLSELSLKFRNRLLMGIYETHERRMCEEFLVADDSVLEIGGAIGFIGLFCQKRLGIRNYFVFEANPRTFAILKRNYELNGVHAKAWNLALGPSDEPLELDIGTDFWENSVILRGEARFRRTIKVQGASFGTLLNVVDQPVNVLIIDVEGAEQFIDPADIPETVNKVIIELHPDVLGPAKTHELIAGLVGRGFTVAREDSGTFGFIKARRTGSATVPKRECAHPS